MIARRDVDNLAQDLDHAHVVGIGLRGVVCLVPDEFDGGLEQEDGEEVEDVRPGRNDRCAKEDEGKSEEKRQGDADEQHLLLVLARNFKGTHDEREDEEVIDDDAFSVT